MDRNSSVLKKGHKIAVDSIRKHLIAIGYQQAKAALRDAVEFWEDSTFRNDLTGNTKTGFCAGLYYDRTLVRQPITVFEALSLKRPTHKMTQPGQSGFADYGSGEWIGSRKDPEVYEYASKAMDENENYTLGFVKTNINAFAYELTSSWLTKFKPSKKGMVVVVANAVPYGDFLRLERGFDILESARYNAQHQIAHAVSITDFENYVVIGKIYG